MRRLMTLAALSAALLLALGGTAFAEAKVTITDGGLKPESVEVDVRESITWTNATDADVALVMTSPAWESGPIKPGGTFQIKITEKGSYSYESADGSLKGTIVVGATAGGGGTGGDDEETKRDRPAKRDKAVDPDDEALPQTGSDAAVPGALSVLLIAFGAGLLVVTRPGRRLPV